MADGELAGKANDEIESRNENPVDRDQRSQMHLVLIARPPRQCRKHNQQRRCSGDRTQCALAQTGRTFRAPNNPSGFSSRISMSAPTETVF